jgi:hypothetical protein
MDLAGNSEAVKSQTYTITTGTIMATVELKDSAGNPLSGGVVQYYSGSWRSFGTTGADGQVSKELGPGSYRFRITYAFAHERKSQDIAADPTVVFQTGQVHSNSGRCTQYNAGGWHVFTQDMQLLPGTYSFRFKDKPRSRSYRIKAGEVNHIH